MTYFKFYITKSRRLKLNHLLCETNFADIIYTHFITIHTLLYDTRTMVECSRYSNGTIFEP